MIVAFGAGALSHGLRLRADLWQGVPIVFAFVDETAVELSHLPPDVTGKTTRMRLQDMLTAARAVIPDLSHVALLGDRLESQPAFAHLAKELPAVSSQIDVLDMTGLPMAELRNRVSALPDKTAILYTAIYSDGAGTYFPPSDGVAMIAEVANSPIMVPVETYLGRGAVGGFVTIPSVVGNEAAQQALELIEGNPLSSIPISAGASLRPVFDWQKMREWGVDERNLPANSEVRNRVLSIWAQYPLLTAIVATAVVLESMMIAGLLYEHRRRRRAEIESSARLNELAHLNRQATAGELSASIAHEVNQPLGAILAHAEAAQLILERSANPDVQVMKDIVNDIKRENHRASEVIIRLRRLLKKEQFDREPVDLNQTLADVFRFLSFQASKSNVELEEMLSTERLVVSGDTIQLQQVVLNLVVNSIEAICDNRGELRKITGRTARAGNGTAEISVSDTGAGIPTDQLKKVFEPFYSTKPQGMGMGLSIVRTIVETHGGSIIVDNQGHGGAVFRIQLPLIKAESEPGH